MSDLATLPVDWCYCVTCTHWCGHVKPNPFYTRIEYDKKERALCIIQKGWGEILGETAKCGFYKQRFYPRIK